MKNPRESPRAKNSMDIDNLGELPQEKRKVLFLRPDGPSPLPGATVSSPQHHESGMTKLARFGAALVALFMGLALVHQLSITGSAGVIEETPPERVPGFEFMSVTGTDKFCADLLEKFTQRALQGHGLRGSYGIDVVVLAGDMDADGQSLVIQVLWYLRDNDAGVILAVYRQANRVPLDVVNNHPEAIWPGAGTGIAPALASAARRWEQQKTQPRSPGAGFSSLGSPA